MKLGVSEAGVYEARWSVHNGTRWVQRTKSLKTRNLEDAKIALAALSMGGTAPVKKDHTVAELIDLYVEYHVEEQGIGPTQRFSLQPIRAGLGTLHPRDITPEHLKLYRRGYRVGMKDETIRRELGALSAVLNWAVKTGTLSGQLPHIPLPPKGQPRRVFLTEEQEAVFYAHAMGDSVGKRRLSRLTLFVGLALDTAARKEAIQDLTWDRVDLGANMIDYRNPALPETNKKRAVVPISTRLAPLLHRAKSESVGRYVVGFKDIRRTFDRWVAFTPYPWVTPHDMRRTWATLAVRAGVPLWEVAQVLADDPETVARHYAVHVPGYLSGAVNKRWNT